MSAPIAARPAPSTTAGTGPTRASAAVGALLAPPCSALDPPRPRAPPVVAPEGPAVVAARRSSRSRPSSTSASATSRGTPRPRTRAHHLPRLRRRVDRAAAVRRDHRAGHHVPRPAPPRPAADLRPPADGHRLRRSPRSGRSPPSCSASPSCPRSCCSSARCSWSRTARSTTSRDNAEVLWQVPVAVALLSLY